MNQLDSFTVFVLCGVIVFLAMQALVFWQVYHPTQTEASDGEENNR